MKHLFFTFIMLLSLTIFNSCSKEEIVDETNQAQQELTVDEIKSNELDLIQAKNLFVFEENLLFYKDGEIEYNEINNLLNRSSKDNKNEEFSSRFGFEMFGPSAIYGSGRRIYENRKLYLNGVPGLASGIYFCDVYSFSVKINLPRTAVGRILTEESQQGYLNYTNQTRGISQGINNTLSETYLYGRTYYLYVKYNILGQSINRQLPHNTTSVKFIYEYINW